MKLEPPRFEDGKQLIIAGLRGRFTSATWAGIPAQWERLKSHGTLHDQVGKAHYGLCFNVSGGFNYLSGVEVRDTAKLPAGYTHITVPAQRYVVFSHLGHVSKIRDTCDAIWRQWFPRSGYEFAKPAAGAPDFFERYGELFNPETGMSDIEVWIPIR